MREYAQNGRWDLHPQPQTQQPPDKSLIGTVLRWAKFSVSCFVLICLGTGWFLGPLLIAGAMVGFYRSEGVGDTPTPATYDELIAEQWPENRHVVFDDLQMCWDGYAQLPQKNCSIAYVPVYGGDAEEVPAGKQIRLLAKVFDARSEEDIHEKLTARPVTAVLDNDFLPYRFDVKQVLEDLYPGIDVKNCRLLVVGGWMPSHQYSTVCFWTGSVITITSCVLWMIYFVERSQAKRKLNDQQAMATQARVEIDQTF